jgi:hypothetical protein
LHDTKKTVGRGYTHDYTYPTVTRCTNNTQGIVMQSYCTDYRNGTVRVKIFLNRTQREEVRRCLLDVLDAAETFKDQERARRVRGCVWQLHYLLGRGAIDAKFWDDCGEVLSRVSGWLIAGRYGGRPYPARGVKGYRYLLDRCTVEALILPPSAKEAARLCIEIGELLYLELISDTNREDLCHN